MLLCLPLLLPVLFPIFPPLSGTIPANESLLSDSSSYSSEQALQRAKRDRQLGLELVDRRIPAKGLEQRKTLVRAKLAGSSTTNGGTLVKKRSVSDDLHVSAVRNASGGLAYSVDFGEAPKGPKPAQLSSPRRSNATTVRGGGRRRKRNGGTAMTMEFAEWMRKLYAQQQGEQLRRNGTAGARADAASGSSHIAADESPPSGDNVVSPLPEWPDGQRPNFYPILNGSLSPVVSSSDNSTLTEQQQIAPVGELSRPSEDNVRVHAPVWPSKLASSSEESSDGGSSSSSNEESGQEREQHKFAEHKLPHFGDAELSMEVGSVLLAFAAFAIVLALARAKLTAKRVRSQGKGEKKQKY